MLAEMRFPVPQHFVGVPVASIRLRLFIECKYVPVDKGGVVFWMGTKDRAQAELWVINKARLFRKDHPGSFRLHHHLRDNDPVAKLFTSEGNRDEDPFFRSLNQSLNSYIHNATRETLLPKAQNEQVTLLDYPVLICSTFEHFFHTSVATPADPTPMTLPQFEVELDYAYIAANGAKARGYFLVDVVDYSRFEAFVTQLVDEVQAAVPLLTMA
jgi:hypothetical protein